MCDLTLWPNCDQFKNYQLHTEPSHFILSYFFKIYFILKCWIIMRDTWLASSYPWLDDFQISESTKQVLAHFDCYSRCLVKVTDILGKVFLALPRPRSIFDPFSGVVVGGTRTRGSRRTARWRWGTCRSRGSRPARWACPRGQGWRRPGGELPWGHLTPIGQRRA